MIERMSARVRRALLAAAGNVSLFLTVAFFVTGLLVLGPSYWWREQVDLFERYVLIPWGLALCLLRLERRERTPRPGVQWDIVVLLLLLGWIIVPFALRFGGTFNNYGSWHTHTVLFFAVWAMTTEETAARRERLFDFAALLFALASLALGGALLYCVAAVRKFGDVQFAFGVCDGIYLCANGHYNSTGMMTVCCTLMSLAGVSRLRGRPLRLLCAVSAAMMAAATVLTQSRTARYALILALAAMAFGAVLRRARRMRVLCATLAACVLAAASYGGAALLTDAAVAHYNRAALRADAAFPIGAALAEAPEEAPAEALEEAMEEKEAAQDAGSSREQAPYEARAAADASFSGRVAIWRNLLRHWRENPKYLLLGQGIGRIGALVTENTIHEGREGVQIHNAYLQFTADYGLVAMALLLAFFAITAGPALRAGFGRAHRPGYGALMGIVIASLLTGLMESMPLGAMSPMNMMLFFALALLFARGREI